MTKINKFKYECGIIVNVSEIYKNKVGNLPFVFHALCRVDGNTTGKRR
jgi:hypothetical protein